MIEDIYGDLDDDQFEMGETIKQVIINSTSK